MNGRCRIRSAFFFWLNKWKQVNKHAFTVRAIWLLSKWPIEQILDEMPHTSMLVLLSYCYWIARKSEIQMHKWESKTENNSKFKKNLMFKCQFVSLFSGYFHAFGTEMIRYTHTYTNQNSNQFRTLSTTVTQKKKTLTISLC